MKVKMVINGIEGLHDPRNIVIEGISLEAFLHSHKALEQKFKKFQVQYLKDKQELVDIWNTTK